ncbi:cytochrome P450 CYP72A219-like [Impatiens glandulifera]|uniref:cytochrome P450 CYP72A219-like n=1 Tax=Impatiens glandulifera TaxID=253017 RepID=UPI001FB09B32|nr:cytochrome P450 CYP72A219-like [Impatiens glandulifera]
MYEIWSYVLAAAAVIAAAAAWWGWRIVWLKPKRMEKHLKCQGYVGNPYKVLFGDLKDFSALNKHARSTPISFSDDILPRAAPFLHKSINTFGKKSIMWFGHMPRVHLTDTELVKEVLSKNFKYVKTKINPLVKLLLTGLLRYDLDQWAKHRKIINPAFHMDKLKLMLPAFHVSCLEMINELQKATTNESTKEVDVWPYLQTLTADVISRTAFGSSYEEGRKIFQLLKIQAELVTKAVSTLYIPGWRFIPTKRNMRMKKIAKQIDNLLINLINKRVNALKAGESNNEDLLNILLESNFREDKCGKMMGMTIKEVVDECKVFYFAGQETTAALLVWTMVLLAHHQEWQHRAREEVFQVFGKDNKPNFDGLNRLKIVTMILNEVLRLYPPVVQFSRTINEDMKLGESLHLQAGTLIALPIILLHHDKEVWGDDAKEFKPERFAEGISKATKGQFSYLPFSWGPRVCIGQNFALLEAKMAVAMILQHFSFELSPLYTHAPWPTIILQPQFGAPLIMHQI